MGRMKPQALLQQSKKKKGPSKISFRSVIAFNALLVLFVLCVVAFRRHGVITNHTSSQMGDLEGGKQSRLDSFGLSERVPHFAVLNTTKGLISVELFNGGAPKSVGLFVKSSRAGYYNGLAFHRVIKHFMIQGGDALKGGEREDWTQVGHLAGELEASIKHEPFMIATSKLHSDTDSFELFITTTAIPHLDDKLVVFGRVVKGEDVVQEIEEVDTDEHFRPKSPVLINSISFHDEL